MQNILFILFCIKMKNFYKDNNILRCKKYSSSCTWNETYAAHYTMLGIMHEYESFLENHKQRAMQYSDRKKILLFLQLMK